MSDNKVNIAGQQFTLTAAVEHNGMSPNNGHYFAYVKDSSRTGWIKCNDDVIQSVTGNNVQMNGNIHYYLLVRDEVVSPSKSPEDTSTTSPSTSRKLYEGLQSSPDTYAEKVKRNRLSRSGTITGKTTTPLARSGTITEKETASKVLPLSREELYLSSKTSKKCDKPLGN